ncbi:MAG: NTP/NDP exchange transporter [Hyphomicrobiaceae bacterium]
MTTPAPRPIATAADRISRIVAIEPGEIAAVLWSFAYFFCVLCSYYILRPLRDEMGVTVGSGALQWLFVVVFLVMLAVVPLFGWIVSRYARSRIVPIIYGFFVLNLVAFWLLFRVADASASHASAFFVWVSVFNLIVVSLFWSVMSDAWSNDQAKRLYGFIAAGGSAGAITGPLLTHSLVSVAGPTNLLLVSAFFLAVAIGCAVALRQHINEDRPSAADVPTGGSLLAGAQRTLQSPYLRKIALWVLLANLIGTFFYLEQARIIGETMADRTQRVQLFARMDLVVNTLTVLSQLALTAQFLRRLGVGLSIATLPLSAIIGLIALGFAPTLTVIVAVMVAERAIAFAIANPGMRVLYTVVEPEEKYKAQNFIDTVVFRGGDAASGWLINGLARGLGAPASVVAVVALPFAIAWLGLSLMLGREQAARADSSKTGSIR